MHILYRDNARIEPNVSTINQSKKMSKFAQNLRYIFPRIRFSVIYRVAVNYSLGVDSSGSFFLFLLVENGGKKQVAG